MKKIVVLISGRGSNLRAILDAALPVEIAAVISSNPAAAGLETARRRGVVAEAVDHRGFSSREAFDDALAARIDHFTPDLIVLAGFLRILTDGFVQRYPARMINIHPSLLPAFPGLDTHRRALAEGVKIHGCTAHFVTPRLDHGPVIVQAAVPVLPDDTPETLASRVLAQEHIIYPQAIRWFAEDRLSIAPDGGVTVPGATAVLPALLSPWEIQ
ncbi:MAG TPA: phosphoribosylglycinamide formyltransferase [Betaproteobacteria bacterium]|nr:phosphoribosylglycinamide formyltransferase [Betaproteobacteria bacterium]